MLSRVHNVKIKQNVMAAVEMGFLKCLLVEQEPSTTSKGNTKKWELY